MSDIDLHFDDNAASLAERYDSMDFETLYAALRPLMSMSMGRALDVGCGSGRDAHALARRGLDVTAVDRSSAMLEYARSHHGGAGIDWRQDSLPHLHGIDGPFDLVCCFAVWMFLAPEDREASMERLVGLTDVDGMLALSLRHGPAYGRPMLDVPADDVLAMAEAHGFLPLQVEVVPDAMGREDVHWTLMILKRV